MEATVGEIIQWPGVTKSQTRRPVIPDRLILTSFEEARQVFLLHCRAKNLSSRTIPWYEERLELLERYLKDHQPGIALHEITSAMLKDFVCCMQQKEHSKVPGKPLSSYTIAGCVRVMKLFFNFLLDEGYLEVNPSQKMQVPKIQKKLIQPLSDRDIGKLLTPPEGKSFTGFRNYLMVLVFLDTGLRLSELMNLKVKDIHWERYTFCVLGKGNKEREVPFGMQVAKTLHKYLKWRSEVLASDFVFVDASGQRLKMRNVERIVERYAMKTGVQKVHCHQFRHTFALNWIRQGGDTLSLQRILGHTSLEMVRNYVNLAGEDVVLKHRQFGFLDHLSPTGKR